MDKDFSKKNSTQLRDDTEVNLGEYNCECCNPPYVLTLRYDLEMIDGHPRFGVCVLRDPDPGVHEYKSTEDTYKLQENWKLSDDGSQILCDGERLQQLSPETRPSLLSLDDDDDSFGGGMSPTPQDDIHVDTQRDDFYRR